MANNRKRSGAVAKAYTTIGLRYRQRKVTHLSSWHATLRPFFEIQQRPAKRYLHLFVAQGATISMKANFDISAVSNRTPLAKIMFFGSCRNCDKLVDISAQLSNEEKRKLIKTYGTIVRGGFILCKQVVDIDYCETCAQANLS